MHLHSRAAKARFFSAVCLVLSAMLGCTSNSASEARSSSNQAPNAVGDLRIVPISWSTNAGNLMPAAKARSGTAKVPVQSIQPTAGEKTDATSAATGTATDSAEKPATEKPESISGATLGASEAKDAAYCLKCHGPFEKIVERTKAFVTEWDEHVNPHLYVPHDSRTIVDCGQCHAGHAIPFKAGEAIPKATVKYCYSCHHSEELVNCKECHKN